MFRHQPRQRRQDIDLRYGFNSKSRPDAIDDGGGGAVNRS